MKRKPFLLLFFLFGLLCLKEANAETFNAISTGHWTEASTWDQGAVPGAGDDVVIDGYTVTIDGFLNFPSSSIIVNSLTLSNTNVLSNFDSRLEVSSNVTLTIIGNLTMTSNTTNKQLVVTASTSNCIVQVDSDVYMSATAMGEVLIDLNSGATLGLKGSFIRNQNKGALSMESDCTLAYNGMVSQTIISDNAGTAALVEDVFETTNVVLNNPNGFTLTEPFHVKGNLEMSNGIIVATNSFPVIVEGNATITGYNSSNYVNGPVQKKGKTLGSTFVFPVGNATTYAPVTISQVTSKLAEIEVSYLENPPPFGAMAPGLTSVDPSQYWTVSRNVESDPVSITLPWNDASASGLTDLSKAVVAGFNSTSNEWENYGQEAVTGGVGSGVAGTVQSLVSNPPPFSISRFTIGSGDPTGLPVELIKFGAVEQNDQIYIEWKTASELNANYYTLEHSKDGVIFLPMDIIKIFGDSETLKEYHRVDTDPVEGENYYRLKIVDNDGSFEYSSLAIAFFSPGPVVMLTPNPVVDAVALIGGISGEETMLEVFDNNGKQLFYGKVNFENGEFRANTEELNVRTPGIYFLKITGRSDAKVFKFIKID